MSRNSSKFSREAAWRPPPPNRCADVESITYGAFSQRIHARVMARQIPLSGTIEVTRRCPLVCAHCYNNLPMGDRRAQLEELTTAQHGEILDQLADMGCLWLLFTGGEIFARPDFLDIYAHAKRRGFLITLFTNGILISPRIADYLAEWRPLDRKSTRLNSSHQIISYAVFCLK